SERDIDAADFRAGSDGHVLRQGRIGSSGIVTTRVPGQLRGRKVADGCADDVLPGTNAIEPEPPAVVCPGRQDIYGDEGPATRLVPNMLKLHERVGHRIAAFVQDVTFDRRPPFEMKLEILTSLAVSELEGWGSC